MRIDTIVNLVDGELVNSGYISEINQFSNNLKKVKRENLFISNDIEEIKEAIKKGAYGVLFSKDLNIIDDEIAWIKVDNIQDALFRLLKYKLIDKTLYFTDSLTLEIIKSINHDKRIAIIDNLDFVDFLNGDYTFITSIKEIKKLSINVKELSTLANMKIKKTRLFMIEVSYKNKKYELLFPYLYKDELQKAVAFFEENDFAYHLKSIKISRFRPQFINNRYEKVKFGRTNKVVIFGIKNDEYFIRELNYIFENTKYAKVKFYDKNNIENFYKEEYNFAILVGVDIQLKEKQNIETNLL
jgi:ferrochelatase